MSKQNPKEQSAYNNKFDGLMNAAPHKRYKSFAVTVADWESVWLDCDPNQPLPDEGVISVWPEEMFAAAVCTDKPFFKMDVHDFCDLLGAHPEPRFASSRTEKTGRTRRRKICWRTCWKSSTGWSEGVANG